MNNKSLRPTGVQISRRGFLKGIGATALLGFGAATLAACSNNSADSGTETGAKTTTATPSDPALTLDKAAWKYDSENKVYYQLGVSYVASPQAPDIETLGIYIPAGYVNATDNGDNTFTVSINAEGSVGNFNAATAPVVIPVNTPGYASQAAPTEYSYDFISSFMTAGLIYVQPGLRGKDTHADGYKGNAPWGVTDLKAAVRYLRYNAVNLPGKLDGIFVFGHSGGGAQSGVMGASGNSELYTPYLETLGAAMKDSAGNDLSDAVEGAQLWCPITSLDSANLAYEWNMGQFASTGTRAEGTWTKAYSTDLSDAFASYLNGLGLQDEDGKELKLEKSSEGSYLAGSYYDAIIKVIQQSLNDFLSVTTFPYTPSSMQMAGMGVGIGGSGAAAQSGEVPSGAPSGMPSGEMPSGGMMPPGGGPGGATQDTTTYNTVEEYIAHLNEDEEWVQYDAASNTASVTSLRGFANSQKSASKDVGSMDSPSRSQTENTVLGIGADEPLHFSALSRDVLQAKEAEYKSFSDWSEDYAASTYDSDFATTDELGVDVLTRENMYDPVFFLSDKFDGYNKSTVATKWRIRTGIMQGDTALPVEYNISLLLKQMGISNVDFGTIWGQGHTMAELEGDATTNFISWVSEVSGK